MGRQTNLRADELGEGEFGGRPEDGRRKVARWVRRLLSAISYQLSAISYLQMSRTPVRQ